MEGLTHVGGSEVLKEELAWGLMVRESISALEIADMSTT